MPDETSSIPVKLCKSVPLFFISYQIRCQIGRHFPGLFWYCCGLLALAETRLASCSTESAGQPTVSVLGAALGVGADNVLAEGVDTTAIVSGDDGGATHCGGRGGSGNNSGNNRSGRDRVDTVLSKNGVRETVSTADVLQNPSLAGGALKELVSSASKRANGGTSSANNVWSSSCGHGRGGRGRWGRGGASENGDRDIHNVVLGNLEDSGTGLSKDGQGERDDGSATDWLVRRRNRDGVGHHEVARVTRRQKVVGGDLDISGLKVHPNTGGGRIERLVEAVVDGQHIANV
jgi:hypothetical protein